MLYVLYGLGIVNILEDMKVEKRSNCVYTPLQISLSYIVKVILGLKNAYRLDEELGDDVFSQMIFLQIICTLDGDSSKIYVDGRTYEGMRGLRKSTIT